MSDEPFIGPVLPLGHPRYTRGGYSMFGAWQRDHSVERQHKYPINTLVEVKYDRFHDGGACEKVHARLFVLKHNRDCDGTPLYTLATRQMDEEFNNYPWPAQKLLYGIRCNGMTEEDLTPVEVTPALLRGEGALSWGED